MLTKKGKISQTKNYKESKKLIIKKNYQFIKTESL